MFQKAREKFQKIIKSTKHKEEIFDLKSLEKDLNNQINNFL